MISIRSRIGSVNRLILSWTGAAKFNRGVPCCPTEYFVTLRPVSLTTPPLQKSGDETCAVAIQAGRSYLGLRQEKHRRRRGRADVPIFPPTIPRASDCPSRRSGRRFVSLFQRVRNIADLSASQFLPRQTPRRQRSVLPRLNQLPSNTGEFHRWERAERSRHHHPARLSK